MLLKALEFITVIGEEMIKRTKISFVVIDA
jgi:hypothetical protein